MNYQLKIKIVLKCVISVIATLILTRGNAATPTWSYSPQTFQYQMTLASRIMIDCNDSNTRGLLVGAFVNGQCRGVDSNIVLTNGYYSTYITIFSNVQSGEKVTFQVYEPSSDKIYDIVDTVVFEQNLAVNKFSYPYLLMSNYKPTNIHLSSSLVYKRFPIGTTIGKLTTVDKNNSSFLYSIVPMEYQYNYFQIQSDMLQLNKDLIPDTTQILKVKIRTDDLMGCTYDSVYTFTVINNDPPPTGLAPTDSVIFEHSPNATIARKLVAIDLSPSDEHIYELVGGEGDSGNSNFKIEGDQLIVIKDMEYSTNFAIPIRIKITDKARNTIELMTKIILKEYIYTVKPSENTIEEHVPIGTVAKIIDIEDVNASGPYTLSLVEGEGSKDNYRYRISENQLLVNSDIEYDSALVHDVRIGVVNKFSNKIEFKINVNILETINNTQPLKVNNLVTPNSDNVNDVFEIYNAQLYKKYRLEIYDDYGKMVNLYNPNFNPAEGYQNTWSGKNDEGEILPSGTYIYYFFDSLDTQPFKGLIYLIQNK